MTCTLSKRKLPRRDVPLVGALLDHLPYSHLPTKKVVLKRLLFELETNNGGVSLPSAILTVQKELVDLWTYAGYGDILHYTSNILKQIRLLHESYKAVKKIPLSRRTGDAYKKKKNAFDTSLSTLFDIAVEELKSSSRITKKDQDFILNNWDKTISSTQDKITSAAVQKKLARREKEENRLTPQPPACSPQHSSPSPLTKSPTNDADYQPKRPCNTPRSTGTTVQIPRDILQRVGPAADRLLLSNNQLTGIVASITNNCGGDIDDVSLSRSTARRARATARADVASSVRSNFSCGDVCQVNFDGKLLPALGVGSFKKDNRLAVVIVHEEENQILAIARTDDATGAVEATTVKEALDSWGLTESIIACGFDTTASNTGINLGSCKILQDLIQRQILWLACRHHMGELIVKAAFHCIFGKTKGPVETLCKTLQDSWSSIDTQDIQLPTIPTCYRDEADTILDFILTQLEPENVDLLPRGDYKEFLELAKLYLGGSMERKKGYEYHLQKPGADHHARWMSKCIYVLKMCLVEHQLPKLRWQTKQKVKMMSSFIIFTYIRYWFLTPSLCGAAQNDINLFKSIKKFAKVDKKVSTTTAAVLLRHTWYLTEECIPFAIFNETLPEADRDALATALGALPSTTIEIRKPTLPHLTTDSKLLDFVGPRSTLLFDLLNIPHTFLANDNWKDLPEYKTVKDALKKLRPINDSAERALNLATQLNNKMTQDEKFYQDLILAVDKHRKLFGVGTKQDLKKFC